MFRHPLIGFVAQRIALGGVLLLAASV
ncbi:MAG: hypothetical protein ACJAW4_003566, partial [Paracoccaceae bacterium]